MIKTESFFALFLGFYCPIVIVAGTLLYFFGSHEYLIAALWGSALSVILIWITIFSINRLIHSSIGGLQILVFGGFLFRFFIVMFSALFVHFFTELHQVSFISGLFFSYIFLQLIEIIYIQKRFGKKK